MGGELNGQHENNSPESNSKHEITCPTLGQYKNNSPKGWMGGELNGRHENNSPESNSKHENNLPKAWTVLK